MWPHVAYDKPIRQQGMTEKTAFLVAATQQECMCTFKPSALRLLYAKTVGTVLGKQPIKSWE